MASRSDACIYIAEEYKIFRQFETEVAETII